MLTVVAVKNAAPAAKDYKLADSGGLHLFITTRGHKSWRFKYRFGGLCQSNGAAIFQLG